MFSGYKTKLAGVGLMASGVGAALTAAFGGDNVDWGGVTSAIVLFFNGLGFFGVRVAIDSYFQKLGVKH